MDKEFVNLLITKAFEARMQSYSPYSKYRVGAALFTKQGNIFTGCNIENASFGATNCAERTAIFKAVSEGEKEFEAIAVVGGPAEVVQENMFSDYAFPCGICRQVMQEFCGTDFKIIVAKSIEDYQIFQLKDLLPYGFGGNVE